jgi:hypothetical protein
VRAKAHVDVKIIANTAKAIRHFFFGRYPGRPPITHAGPDTTRRISDGANVTRDGGNVQRSGSYLQLASATSHEFVAKAGVAAVKTRYNAAVKNWSLFVLLAMPPFLVALLWCYSFSSATEVQRSQPHIVNGSYARRDLQFFSGVGCFQISARDLVPNTPHKASWLQALDANSGLTLATARWSAADVDGMQYSGVPDLLRTIWQSLFAFDHNAGLLNASGRIPTYGWLIEIPYWVPMILTSLPLLLAAWRHRRRQNRDAAAGAFDVLAAPPAAQASPSPD